jgi:hypothetical protein
MLLFEVHVWMGFFAGHHDLFMYRITLGWVSVYVDRVPVSNALRKLRDQLRTARHELLIRK